MIKITVTTKALKIKAQEIMRHEVMHNPNFNGAEYSIDIGDFDEIEPNDIEGASLFIKIFRNDE